MGGFRLVFLLKKAETGTLVPSTNEHTHTHPHTHTQMVSAKEDQDNDRGNDHPSNNQDNLS